MSPNWITNPFSSPVVTFAIEWYQIGFVLKSQVYLLSHIR